MICVYPADCTDFSTNGNGVLSPLSATVTETLNGEYELQLTHPIDEAGKWQRLSEGCIIRVPVPAAITPRLTMSVQGSSQSETTTVQVYKVNTSTDNLYLRKGPGTAHTAIAKYPRETQVIVLNTSNPEWYEVSCPDGKHGYMYSGYLSFVKQKTVRTETALPDLTEEIESRQLRDQPFRIYRIVPELTQITVYARHIFYDLLDNMIKTYKPSSGSVGASVVQGLSSSCLSEHPFTFYSDLDSSADDVSFENVNPIDALMGENGVIEKYAGELARDWYDVYVVKRVGTESNVQIRQAKNLLGISYDTDLTNVVTRVMPTGEDKNGNVLYLPELFIDSPNINAYPHPKWIHLPVSEAKESNEAGSRKTKSQCYTEMREKAQAEFDAGCDLPTVTLNVDFVNCADTEEYREYGFLQNIFLGDSVHVIAPRVGVEVSMRMTQYTYDCLTKRYTSMTLGTVAETLESSVISARQLPSGIITGSKLAINSVGTGQLQSGSVGAAQIQMAAIETAHIQDAAISNAKIGQAAVGTANIQDASIVRAKISEGAISSAQIEDAAITRAKIGNAAIGTAQIENGVITSAKIGSGEIRTANINDAAITTAKIADGAVQNAKIDDAAISTAKIQDAAITNAKLGNAAVGTANIQDASIVAAKIVDGEIVTAKIADLAVTSGKIADLAVTTAKIANAAITNAQIANTAVGTAQIVLGAITSALIAQGAVGTAQIADASITDAKIVSLNADVISSGTLATERLLIKGDDGIIYEINAESSGLSMTELADPKYKEKLNGSVLVARSVTADQIAAATITANEILAGTITGDKIAAATIEGSNIKAGSITTSHVSSDFGQTLDLSSNTGINLRVSQINDDIDAVRAAAVAQVQVQYVLSTSSSLAPSSGWQTEAPAWEDGKFMWQKTVTTYADGTTESSDPTCLTGATGAAGEAATTLRIESSRGTVFKRDDIATVLSVVIYHGSSRITSITDLRSHFGATAYIQWKWRRRNDNSYGTISSSDSRISDSGFSFTVSTDDVDSNVTFMCELITD